MKKWSILVAVLLISWLAQPSFAQMGGGAAAPKFYGDFRPVVGAWAEYQVTTSGEAMKMKIAVVGKEGNDYWYETVVDAKPDGLVISKMLVSGSPDVSGSVKRMIIKQGREQAMEMPVQMLQTSAGAGKGETKGKIVEKGTESVKVPAGTFKAQRLQYQDGQAVVDTWVQKDVPPYGLVKSVSKETEMVLLGYGTGAKTQITETPQKFEIPQMPWR